MHGDHTSGDEVREVLTQSCHTTLNILMPAVMVDVASPSVADSRAIGCDGVQQFRIAGIRYRQNFGLVAARGAGYNDHMCCPTSRRCFAGTLPASAVVGFIEHRAQTQAVLADAQAEKQFSHHRGLSSCSMLLWALTMSTSCFSANAGAAAPSRSTRSNFAATVTHGIAADHCKSHFICALRSSDTTCANSQVNAWR